MTDARRPHKHWAMIESHDYRLHLDGGTDGTGRMTAPGDDLPALDVAAPPEFGGQGSIWSPEHLFVASVSSCLMTTFRAIADASSLEFVDYSDDPSGHLVRDENRLYRMESVTLRPRVVITDPDKVDKAHRILDKAERACLISRSLEATVQMEPTVQVAEG